MDKISKALNKLSPKERKKLKIILKKIKQGQFDNFEIKKLKSHNSIFRIRQGKMRIIFIKKENNFSLLAVERRSDHTYNI